MGKNTDSMEVFRPFWEILKDFFCPINPLKLLKSYIINRLTYLFLREAFQ